MYPVSWSFSNDGFRQFIPIFSNKTPYDGGHLEFRPKSLVISLSYVKLVKVTAITSFASSRFKIGLLTDCVKVQNAYFLFENVRS